MRKYNILKRNEDFDKIIKEGTKKMNKYFILYYLPSLSDDIECFRVGISVPKKFGIAVIRNRQKRIAREIIFNSNVKIKKYDYVLISRPLVKDVKFTTQVKYLVSLFKEIK